MRSVGRTAAPRQCRKAAGEESPGSTDKRCRITSGGDKTPGTVPQRKDRLGALHLAAARVKRCGKSAPRFRRRKRHGKPHREQDRIGGARGGEQAGVTLARGGGVGRGRRGAGGEGSGGVGVGVRRRAQPGAGPRGGLFGGGGEGKTPGAPRQFSRGYAANRRFRPQIEE